MGPVHPLSGQDSDRGKNLCKTAGVIREIMHRLPKCNIAYQSWFPYSEKKNARHTLLLPYHAQLVGR